MTLTVACQKSTVGRCIKDLSVNVKRQVSYKAYAFDFYLFACDESTDATNTAQLQCFLETQKKCEYTKSYTADSQIKISSAVFGNFFKFVEIFAICLEKYSTDCLIRG